MLVARRDQQPRLQRTERRGHIRADAHAWHVSGIRVDSAGKIDGDDQCIAVRHLPCHFCGRFAQRSRAADAHDSVNNKVGIAQCLCNVIDRFDFSDGSSGSPQGDEAAFVRVARDQQRFNSCPALRQSSTSEKCVPTVVTATDDEDDASAVHTANRTSQHLGTHTC